MRTSTAALTARDLPKAQASTEPAAPTAPLEPVAAPPEPKPETITKEPTLDEAREIARKKVMSEVFGNSDSPAPKKESKTDDAAPSTDAPAVVTDEQPKPAPKKPRKVAPKPELDAAAITAAATTAATKAVAEANRNASPDPAKTEPAGDRPDISILQEEDREAVPVFEKMEQMNPAKYKGLVNKLVDYEKKQSDYVAQWEKDHPGEEYDADDSAHDTWHAKNKPKWSEVDFGRALAKLETEPLVQKLEKQERDQQDAAERGERMAKVRPDLEAINGAVPKLIAESINPDFSSVDKLKSDPLAVEIVQRATAHVQQDIHQLAGILASTIKYDDNNPTHQRVLDAAVNLEKEVLSLDPEDRVREGKDFATREQFFKMSPREQSRHWTPEFQDIAGYMARKTADFAKNMHAKEMERVRAMAEQMGYVKNTESKVTPKANGSPASKPQPEQRFVQSPTHAPGAPAPATQVTPKSKTPAWQTALGW